ncbi:MAG: hypothetical protein JXQ93_05640 [Flavobacteriaceae bacterium]
MPEEIEQKKSKINWTADKIMSTSALVIALVSLIALFYQLSLAHEENELIRKQQSASVLPHLNQWFSNLGGYKIIFGNKGVGPAFIKEVSFKLNDSLEYKNTDHLFEKVKKLIPELNKYPVITSTFKSGTVLPANQTIEILNLKTKEAEILFKNFFRKNKITYRVIYADIYGSKWMLSNESGNSTPIEILKNK